MTTFLKLVQICLGIILFLVLVQKCIEKNVQLMITVSNNKSCSTHPHNLYFQLFAETGLVGASIFILIYLYILRRLYVLFKKKKKTFNPKDHISFFMITSLFINFWPLIPSGSFFNNWINVLYFLPLGIYLFSSSKSKLNEK